MWFRNVHVFLLFLLFLLYRDCSKRFSVFYRKCCNFFLIHETIFGCDKIYLVMKDFLSNIVVQCWTSFPNTLHIWSRRFTYLCTLIWSTTKCHNINDPLQNEKIWYWRKYIVQSNELMGIIVYIAIFSLNRLVINWIFS